MPRINIEDSLFKDSRFLDLLIKLGNKDEAIGAIVRAIMLAKKHYLASDSDRLIPLDEWKKQGICNEIINVGLAEKRGSYVYLSGSEEQFAWLQQKSDAGRKGGLKKQENKEKLRLKLLKKQENLADSSGVKRGLAGPSGAKPHSHSHSHSLTHSLNSNSNSNSENITLSTRESVERDISTQPTKKNHWLVELWNEHCGDLPKARRTSQTRLRKIQARIKTESNREDWEAGIKKIAASKFANGKMIVVGELILIFYCKPMRSPKFLRAATTIVKLTRKPVRTLYPRATQLCLKKRSRGSYEQNESGDNAG